MTGRQAYIARPMAHEVSMLPPLDFPEAVVPEGMQGGIFDSDF